MYFSAVVQTDFVEFEVWNEKINGSKACGTNNMQPPNLIHSEKFAFKAGDKSKTKMNGSTLIQYN